MFCALTTPSPDERTDLGVIFPLMVLINFKLVSPDTTAAGANVVLAQMEEAKSRIPKVLRLF